MKKSTLASSVLMLLLISAGCSGSKSSGDRKEPDIGPDVEAVDSPLRLARRASTELTNVLADVLTEIKDKDSARKAEPKLVVLTRKAKVLAIKSKNLKLDDPATVSGQLPNPKDKEDFEKACRRTEAEVKRIRANPELNKLLREMDLEGLLE